MSFKGSGEKAMGAHIPTVRSRRLAAELKRLREGMNLTWEQVAADMGWSASKVYRIEADKVGVLVRDVRRLLDLYGVTGESYETLVELSKRAREKGWWHQYGEVIPEWFQIFVSLEAEASALHEYESELVPGLLQTERYAEAILQVPPHGPSIDDIEGRIAVRMTRQRRLTTREGQLTLWTVLNEAVIRRLVGSGAIMREQLAHLIELGKLDNVTLQLLPFGVGAHASMRSSFTVLQLSEQSNPDVVYLEAPTGALYIEKLDDVRRYRLMFDHLRAQALGPRESEALIAKAVNDLS
jgi:transcriptional regulator with XRE-family HTH domain